MSLLSQLKWKDISWFDNLYEISTTWKVRNKITWDILAITAHKTNWYCYISLKRKAHRYHRFLAKAFIPNPDNKPEVNHIDWDKTNNKLSNLEWATRSENMLHLYNELWCVIWTKWIIGKDSHLAKEILQYTKEWEYIRTFECMKEAAESIWRHPSNLSKVLSGGQKTSGGFIWKLI